LPANTAGGLGGLQGAVLVRNSIVYSNTGWKPKLVFGVWRSRNSPIAAPLRIPAGGADLGGNTDADPLFANAAGGDYRLAPGSPCIDTGTNEYTGTLDLAGKPRIYNWHRGYGRVWYQGVTTYYVTTNGTGNGDSWASAANTIQAAIDRADAGDIVLGQQRCV